MYTAKEFFQRVCDNAVEDNSTVCVGCPHFKWTKSKRVVEKASMFSRKKEKVVVKPSGTCHLNHPGENTPVGAFPVVLPDDWCSAHPKRGNI